MPLWDFRRSFNAVGPVRKRFRRRHRESFIHIGMTSIWYHSINHAWPNVEKMKSTKHLTRKWIAESDELYALVDVQPLVAVV